MDFKNKEFKTAVKTIVLDGPEIDIKVRLDCGTLVQQPKSLS